MYIIVDDVTEEKPSPNASKGYYHIGFCAVLKIMLSIFVKIRKCLFMTKSCTQGRSWGHNNCWRDMNGDL